MSRSGGTAVKKSAEMRTRPAVWFPAVRANTGADVFTERLANALIECGIQAEICWLPLRAEYAPWSVPIPTTPAWATVAHINTWLHPRFIPEDLPLVATIHHAVHHPDAESYKGLSRTAYHKHWIAPIERRSIQRANKVIAVSQFVADSAKHSLVDIPIQVIYNGIDAKLFRPGGRVRYFGEPLRLLYVGSWVARKGVDLLAPIMRELGEGFELHYTGGPAAEYDKAHMPLNMIDIGRLQGDAAVAAAMQNADALLFPSRSEGFGLVAAEAMACGLPVVASRIGPLVEIIDHGESGLLCSMNDVTGFVTAIRKLSTDQNLLDDMRRGVSRRAKEQFSEKVMVRSYLDAYQAITSAALIPRTL